MANILVTTIPMFGHIYPMIPIVKELLKRGHNIKWIIEKKFKDEIEEDPIIYKYMDENKFSIFVNKSQLGHKPIDFSLINIFNNYDKLKTQIKYTFYDYTLLQIPIIKDSMKDFTPSIILTDCIYIASLLIAKEKKIPCVVLGIIPYTAKSKNTAPYGIGWRPTNNIISHHRNYFMHFIVKSIYLNNFFSYIKNKENEIIRLLSSFRIEVLSKESFFDTFTNLCDLYIQASIEELEYDRENLDSKFHFIGPSIYKPKKISSNHKQLINTIKSKKPLIFVTQGSVDNDNPNLLISCFEAFKNKKEITLVMDVPKKHQPDFCDNCPKNIEVTNELPYHYIIPHIDIFITNGGFGGVQLALSHGIPIIVAGRTDDKGEVAARIAWSKCGINLKTSNPSSRKIRKATKKILNKSIYKLEAEKIGNIIKNKNAPKTACDLMNKLIG